eukprot:778811-Ditylum_brightwellii.AAC.1
MSSNPMKDIMVGEANDKSVAMKAKAKTETNQEVKPDVKHTGKARQSNSLCCIQEHQEDVNRQRGDQGITQGLYHVPF